MKKLYLLMACAAMTLGAQAVNLKFMLGDQEITPGSTVKFTEYSAEEFERGVWDILMKPDLSIVSDFFTNTVTVTATCTSGQNIQMCCGGNCAKGESVTKEDLTLRQNQPLSLDFEFMETEYEGDEVPDVITRFTATDDGGDPVEFTLVMGPGASALETIGGVAESVQPVTGGIAWSVADATTLDLYSVAGTRVLSVLCEGNGTVSTSALAPGIYIYTLGANTGKIIIK